VKTPTECNWDFPPSRKWPSRDFIIPGADLAPDTLLYAYAHGLFPMYSDRELWWWSPVHRGIIPFNNFHVSHSLRKSARRFTCTINKDFVGVMEKCATTHSEGNWINDEFIDAYTHLHQLGHAHSIEVWNDSNELVGGVYGIRINRFFAGESMFHTETDASKVALLYLVQLMILDDMALFDVQWLTDHLASLGAIAVPRAEYLARLADAVAEG
jgi:leucyl/phenylalanyl-tRNA--protein transferase